MTELLNLSPQVAYEIALNKDAVIMEQVLRAMSNSIDFTSRPEFFVASIKNNSHGAEILGVIFRYAHGQINIDTFIADIRTSSCIKYLLKYPVTPNLLRLFYKIGISHRQIGVLAALIEHPDFRGAVDAWSYCLAVCAAADEMRYRELDRNYLKDIQNEAVEMSILSGNSKFAHMVYNELNVTSVAIRDALHRV